jgi:hypothetical protein
MTLCAFRASVFQKQETENKGGRWKVQKSNDGVFPWLCEVEFKATDAALNWQGQDGRGYTMWADSRKW